MASAPAIGWLLPGLADEPWLVKPGRVGAPARAEVVRTEILVSFIGKWLLWPGTRALVMQMYRAVSAPLEVGPQRWATTEVDAYLRPALRHAFESGQLVAYRGWLRDEQPGAPRRPSRPPSEPPPSDPLPPSQPPALPSNPPSAPMQHALVDTIRISSVTIATDHGLMKDSRPFYSDWANRGPLFAEPEWTASRQHPVSHDMDALVGLRLELEVEPAGSLPRTATLRGTGRGGLIFQGVPMLFAPGRLVVEVASRGKLPERIQRHELAIDWTTLEQELTVTPSRTSNRTYLTMSQPLHDHEATRQEDGVTLKRMARAVEWAEPIDSLDPHTIVRNLARKFKRYTNTPNPAVPWQFNHPFYRNFVGGAWALSDYEAETGECQAIVRLVRGMLRQLGVPGKTNVHVVWADPEVDNGETALEADLEQLPTAGLTRSRIVPAETDWEEHWAALIDDKVEEGQQYTLEDGQPGLNRYEACLRFEHNGDVVYYAGGAGEHLDKESVIRSFWGLAWIRWDGPGIYTVIEVVKTWRE